jgi:hypothetical protein
MVLFSAVLKVPRKATNEVQGQSRHFAPQQDIHLLDHLVGAGEQRGWHREAEGFGGFDVDC